MRKHSVRKWIHAILDLLPLLVIPIFAINIINRSVEPISVTVENEIYQQVDFNQKISLNDNCFRYYTQFNNNSVQWDNVYVNTGNSFIYYNDLVVGHQYYLKNNVIQFVAYDDEENTIDVTSSKYPRLYFNGTSSGHTYLYEGIFTATNSQVYLNFSSTNRQMYIHMTSQTNLFDLTQMFGEGNEPTLEEFNNYFPNNYYSYTQSEIMNINVGTDSIVYNDTDIGSQFVYSLYHVTDKYFNMNDTFDLGQVYEWFSTNIFGGNPPLAVPIVWNVIIYEFIMDLLFLLYAVFMFIIDFAESFIERMFDKSRCGGR